MRRRPFGEPAAEPDAAGARPARRWRRWALALACMAALLATYAVALQWFSQLVGDDVQHSIRALPSTDDPGTARQPSPAR